MAVDAPQIIRRFLQSRLLPVLVFLGGCLLSLGAWWLVRLETERSDQFVTPVKQYAVQPKHRQGQFGHGDGVGFRYRGR